jgi:hypothetical protein
MENEKIQNIFDSTRRSSVSVLAILYHDTNENVMVMKDLGPLLTISDFFTDAIGGYFGIADLAAQLERSRSLSLSTISISDAERERFFIQAGSQFGTFFAIAHSPKTLDIIRIRFGHYREFPSDSSLQEVTGRFTMSPMKQPLKSFSLQS